MKKYHPLGELRSKGSFEDFFDTARYDNVEQAWKANDFVVCDFMKDDKDVKYIAVYHSTEPQSKIIHELYYQNFIPKLGIDALDDHEVSEIAERIMILRR